MATYKFFSKSNKSHEPLQMGGQSNWRKKLSNFWPVQICPTSINIDGREIFNGEQIFCSVEQAFHWAKYHFTEQEPTPIEIQDPLCHYPNIITRSVPIVDDDSHFKSKIQPFMTKVKSSSSKGQMKRRKCSLDVELWNNARVPIMLHLLRARLAVDGGFRSILQASTGVLLHTDRAGAKSFWGGSDKGGTNTLGQLLMQLREELATTTTFKK